MSSETIKLQLVQNIINLPESKLAAANEFISRLVADNASGANKNVNNVAPSVSDQLKTSSPTDWASVDNPMLKFIGLVSYEPPASSIDEELYGGQPR